MIEVKNLVKQYGKHTAVDDISFTVQTGKVVGFLGPNGAGKSTTMNMITGYIAPTSGTVLIDGINILEEPDQAKKHIGYLPEVPPLYNDMRVCEYLTFVSELKKVPKNNREKEVESAMQKTMTKDVSERLIRHLSKGYRQRVGLAGTLISSPDILILDEPTVGLDPAQIIEIRELIRELSVDKTILLSSHIMQEISAVCDEIIIINKGKMLTCDTPENLTGQISNSNILSLQVRGDQALIFDTLQKIDGLLNMEDDGELSGEDKAEKAGDDAVDSGARPVTEKEQIHTFTVTSNTDIREEIFFALAAIRCPIYGMQTKNSSLEDVFLTLTQEDNRNATPEQDEPPKKEKREKKRKKRLPDAQDQKEETQNPAPKESPEKAADKNESEKGGTF